MKRHGEKFEMNMNLMDAIAVYMDDELREQIHREMAPCKSEEFLQRYLELDPDFEDLLHQEFGIEL